MADSLSISLVSFGWALDEKKRRARVVLATAMDLRIVNLATPILAAVTLTDQGRKCESRRSESEIRRLAFVDAALSPLVCTSAARGKWKEKGKERKETVA